MRRRRAGHGDAGRAPIGALALVLALGSSLVWGSADFAGGSLTKRLPAFAVTVLSQGAGFLALCVAVSVRGDLGGRSFLLGLLAGVGGGAGLAAFYRALSLGTMSVVSPLVACGAVVPFGVSIATGERPAAVAVAGAVLALAGAVLASVEERRAESPERARAVLLAVAAALFLGGFVYFLGLGSREGDALSTLFGARVGSLALLVALALALRAPLGVARGSIVPVALVGLADVTANALFALASGHGLLSLVSVLGSLYPIVTVLLAHVLLGERLTRAQQAGVAVALAGVCTIAAG
ncbi:MAG TPA: EamA family transporter [Gaiellaceae bacterium]|nr:EamA family transporter [Gaiellaceae bacterium]